ncbi:MAG: MBL fold metallo-hydrolase, partial [Actinobacteria bacterium]|nr:MBL fold metallo-hydrolase [Actinomycetota bacterium]
MKGPLHLEDGMLAVRKLCVGPFENNVYVVACRETARAIVVDAADEADRIVAACDGIDVIAIVTTHGHRDHIQAAEAVGSALDAQLLIHPDDAGDLSGT